MNLLTKLGFTKIKTTLTEKIDERVNILNALQEAKSQGDLSENAGYTAAKAALRSVDRRIDELRTVLHTYSVHDKIDKSKVNFGAYVKVKELTQNHDRLFRIVSEHELSFLAEDNVVLLTSKSPVAKALLMNGIGAVIDIETQAGLRSYNILDISEDLNDIC